MSDYYTGRPPKFESPEDMEVLINDYFKSLEYIDNDGHPQTQQPTITGLALHLGFCSRQSMYDYKANPKFSYTIKHALMLVENGYEKAACGKNPTGPIFVLKNMGWSDKVEIDQETTIVDKRKRIAFD